MTYPLNQHAENNDQGLKRYVDSQPIINRLAELSNAGRSHFDGNHAWEVCLCALILKLNPVCTVPTMLEALPSDDRCLGDIDFLNTMAHLGYFCRRARCNVYDIDDRLLPGVFIPANGDPCIVIGRAKDDTLQFYDPLSKLVSTVPPSFDQDGQVWFFQVYDENRTALSKFMRKGSNHTWFRALLGRFKGTFAQVMTAGFILNLIALITPLFIMLVYDRVIASGSLHTLPMLSLGAFIAIGFEWRLRYIRSNGLSWLSGRLDNVVSNKIFSHLVGLPPQTIENASVAAQIARIKTFESVRDFFSGSVFLSLLEAPFVILAIGAVALIAGKLVLVPLAMILGYATLFWFIRKRVKIMIRLAAKASSARQQFTIETFEKLDGIRLHGLAKKWHEKFRHLSGREMMAHFHLGWLGIVSETLAHTLTVIAAIATIGYGVNMIWESTLSTGALVATMILVWRILTPFHALCTMVPRLEQLRNSIMQVNTLMDIETERESAKAYSRLPTIKGDIEFQSVSFRYEEGLGMVFSDLSFKARAGDMVVISGVNGSGKASVLKLIKSMYTPEHGVVRIDGFDLRQLDAVDLRRKIAYIPKVPEFFNGSIAQNLRYSNPLASENDLKNALDMAGVWDAVSDMPDGLDTIIGSHGNTALIPSLAMRLSLARAYLHTGNIILINELPNSVLRGETGNNLKEFLARIKGKRTVIMCSHREDVMNMADTIVCLRGLETPVVGNRADMMTYLDHSSHYGVLAG